MKILYGIGLGYVLLCGALVLRHAALTPRPRRVVVRASGYAGRIPRAGHGRDSAGWFAAAKPMCNAVEVETYVRSTPPPIDGDGQAYLAACFALAGKMERARQTLDRLPVASRPSAASVVFYVGHPVADAGDDRAAGPIMRLVLDYQPDNYMALYHAGMAEYALGENATATSHLRRFRQLYRNGDGWTANAQTVLDRIAAGKPMEQRFPD